MNRNIIKITNIILNHAAKNDVEVLREMYYRIFCKSSNELERNKMMAMREKYACYGRYNESEGLCIECDVKFECRRDTKGKEDE